MILAAAEYLYASYQFHIPGSRSPANDSNNSQFVIVPGGPPCELSALMSPTIV